MRIKLYFVTLVVIVMAALTVGAQSNTFTYQGRLTDNNLAAVGTYEMQFRVFDAALAGNQLPQPTPITLTFTVAGTNPVTVSNGAFTVHLNFGAAVFTGADRWLDISVRKPSDPPGFTLLTPRQPITSSPYAIKTINANTADSVTAACLLCITDAHISGIDGSKVTGTVASATNAATATVATTAGNVTGVVAIANGGTGSSTQNFVDLTTNQTVGGTKTFTNPPVGNGSQLTNINGANITNNSINGSALAYGVARGIDLPLLAMLRWDQLASTKTFAVGTYPNAVAFDGANIWVANYNNNNVTKLRASDGAVQGTFAVGNPIAVAFDGANIWVTNYTLNNVTKLLASTGAVQGTFAVGTSPLGVAFDGANIWVANQSSTNVTKLLASTGAVQGTFAVGTSPSGIAFDGYNIWVANFNSNNVTKLLASTGAVLGTYAVGTGPQFIAFDGANIWVSNFNSNNVTKLLASTGAVLGTFAVGIGPSGIAFDGANIWVANSGSNNVTKLPVFP